MTAKITENNNELTASLTRSISYNFMMATGGKYTFTSRRMTHQWSVQGTVLSAWESPNSITPTFTETSRGESPRGSLSQSRRNGIWAWRCAYDTV